MTAPRCAICPSAPTTKEDQRWRSRARRRHRVSPRAVARVATRRLRNSHAAKRAESRRLKHVPRAPLRAAEPREFAYDRARPIRGRRLVWVWLAGASRLGAARSSFSVRQAQPTRPLVVHSARAKRDSAARVEGKYSPAVRCPLALTATHSVTGIVRDDARPKLQTFAVALGHTHNPASW